MLTLFTRYASVGVVNTVIHWLIFAFCFGLLHLNQMLANFLAFCSAVTFSFIANARWTFKARTSLLRYFSFTSFMGGIALLTGYTADRIHLMPVVTLIVFSLISFILGFAYSKYVVFREEY